MLYEMEIFKTKIILSLVLKIFLTIVIYSKLIVFLYYKYLNINVWVKDVNILSEGDFNMHEDLKKVLKNFIKHANK